MPLLPDPRPEILTMPKNPILQAAQAVQTAADADLEMATLQQTLCDALSIGDEKTLALALQFAPPPLYAVIWQALQRVLAQHELGNARHMIVVLPLVFVAGSLKATETPAQISDADAIVKILQNHGCLAKNAEVRFFSELLHPESLAAVSFSQQFLKTQALQDLSKPFALLGAPILAKEESVYVRYLLGVARANDGENILKNQPDSGAWAMEIMQAMHAQLKTEGVSLFCIPQLPATLPEALRLGARCRLDIHRQLFASNAIRKLREHQMPIIAIASAHEGGELRFTISTEGDTKHMSAFAWPLAPLDSVADIAASFADLMQECQVSDLRFIAQIQPDKQADGTPFFISSIDPEAQMPSLQ